MKIILASSSPRRKELMKLMNLKFDVMPSDVEEDMSINCSIQQLAKLLSKQKCEDGFNKTSGDRVVIGSDCMVVFNEQRFGKPKDRTMAKNMLQTLSNNWHKVISGLCVYIQKNGKVKKYVTYDIAKVKFIQLSDKMIDDYLDLGEYKDKAGAYAIQGYGNVFVQKINGAYTTIVGLPTSKLYKILKKENII